MRTLIPAFSLACALAVGSADGATVDDPLSTASITAGGASVVGVGAAVACSTGYVCDSRSGELTIATGGGVSAAGTVASISFSAVAHAGKPACVVDLRGGSIYLAPDHAETTSGMILTNGVPFASNWTYHASYHCGGG